MSANEIHVGASIPFTFTVQDDGSVVDVSDATTKEFIFRRPDGTTFTVPVSFVTDGTDGKLTYTTVKDTDLDQDGSWRVQGFVETPVFSNHTEIYNFKVFRNL